MTATPERDDLQITALYDIAKELAKIHRETQDTNRLLTLLFKLNGPIVNNGKTQEVQGPEAL